MPYCMVPKCNWGKYGKRGCKFFHLPSDEVLRKKWLRRMKLDFKPKKKASEKGLFVLKCYLSM